MCLVYSLEEIAGARRGWAGAPTPPVVSLGHPHQAPTAIARRQQGSTATMPSFAQTLAAAAKLAHGPVPAEAWACDVTGTASPRDNLQRPTARRLFPKAPGKDLVFKYCDQQDRPVRVSNKFLCIFSLGMPPIILRHTARG